MDSIYAQCESGMPKTPSLLAQFKFLRRPGGLVATGQTAIDGQARRQEQDQQHHQEGSMYKSQVHTYTRADVQGIGQVISEGL